jgi:hypothetical protein
MRHAPPKRQFIFNELNGLISQMKERSINGVFIESERTGRHVEFASK